MAVATEPTATEQAEAAETAKEPGKVEVAPRDVGSPLTAEQITALDADLDQSRIRSRAGRGRDKYSYLAAHDIKRTANRIFGYGNWGHAVNEQVEIGAVEVEREVGDGQNKRVQRGWHVSYRTVVTVTVRGCVPTDGTGYGDGVEYTPAARVTACELALKESESDALKRAFTAFGDQFGLILYAKDDEKRRIESDQAADESRVASNAPMSIKDALGRLTMFVADGAPWVKEAIERSHPDITEFKGFPSLPEERRGDVRIDAIKRLQNVVVALEAEQAKGFDPVKDPEGTQTLVRTTFSKAFDGAAIMGPEPFEPALPF